MLPRLCDLASSRDEFKPHRTRWQNKMPDVDLANRHPALQSMCSKD